MGGGAMHIIDLPAFQWKAASSSPLPSQTPLVSFSSTTSNPNFPVSVNNNTINAESACGNNTARKELEYCVGGREEVIRASSGGPCFDAILGTVPSPFEVENAVAALLNFIEGIWPSGSELNQFWQMLDLDLDLDLDLSINVGSLLSNGCGRLLDAFRLLQTDPSIKRLVLSLSSDRAIWDAIMNHDTVQKLRRSNHHSVRHYSLPSCEEEPNAIAPALKWIMDLIKTKISELIQNFQKLLDEFLQPHPLDYYNDKGASKKEAIDERVKSSVLLVVVILLTVVLTRVKCA